MKVAITSLLCVVPSHMVFNDSSSYTIWSTTSFKQFLIWFHSDTLGQVLELSFCLLNEQNNNLPSKLNLASTSIWMDNGPRAVPMLWTLNEFWYACVPVFLNRTAVWCLWKADTSRCLLQFLDTRCEVIWFFCTCGTLCQCAIQNNTFLHWIGKSHNRA